MWTRAETDIVRNELVQELIALGATRDQLRKKCMPKAEREVLRSAAKRADEEFDAFLTRAYPLNDEHEKFPWKPLSRLVKPREPK